MYTLYIQVHIHWLQPGTSSISLASSLLSLSSIIASLNLSPSVSLSLSLIIFRALQRVLQRCTHWYSRSHHKRDLQVRVKIFITGSLTFRHTLRFLICLGKGYEGPTEIMGYNQPIGLCAYTTIHYCSLLLTWNAQEIPVLQGKYCWSLE